MDQNWVIFFMNYVIPITITLIGLWLLIKPPKPGNGWFGHYSARSMSSKEAWKYAQKSYGKKSLLMGIIALAISILLNVAFGASARTVVNFVNLAIGVIVLVAPYAMVEKELKRRFG